MKKLFILMLGLIGVFGFVHVSNAHDPSECECECHENDAQTSADAKAENSVVSSPQSFGIDSFSRNPYNPFAQMERMRQQMDRMFEGFMMDDSGMTGMFNSNMSFDSKYDIQEEDDKFIVKFDITGMNPEKLKIDVNDHSISVSGEQSKQVTNEGEDGYFQSQSFGSFMKSIPLPSGVDHEQMTTEIQGDELIITLPKS